MKAVRAFARVDRLNSLVAHSAEVLGMQMGVTTGTVFPVVFGIYCFKLTFKPVSIIASPISHPDEVRANLVFYTAGPDIASPFVRDLNGDYYSCPVGYQDAGVVCRGEEGTGLTVPYGGFFVVFDGSI
jgi:hypothetical protein